MTALKLFSYLYCQRTTRYPKDQKDPDPEKPKIQTLEKPGSIRKTKNEDPTLRKATKKKQIQ